MSGDHYCLQHGWSLCTCKMQHNIVPHAPVQYVQVPSPEIDFSKCVLTVNRPFDKEVKFTNRQRLLQIFVETLTMFNPMSDAVDYEDEALSILSRFVESALQLAEDRHKAIIVAENIVRQVFQFWFNETDVPDLAALTTSLVDAYIEFSK